ncbi:hypothetical protein [uncultured Tateyamaria sp.]|uniref:hypothetical protein n=1 Tax=uncultured Tateyamaria sp. TaxID=455651 RepID=UPI00260B0C0A|nr:hypothetical protein [uncultured Tateyamaria sp.]
MQRTHDNTLWRALLTCAYFLRIKPRATLPKGTALPPLSPHILRDIGLTPSEAERLRHRWPSQSTHHPYL